MSCLHNALLVDLLVRVDDVIKLDFGGVSRCSAPVELDLVSLAYLDRVGVHLAYPINDAHNQLVQVSSSKEAYLLAKGHLCLLYTSPSPRDRQKSRMPSSA